MDAMGKPLAWLKWNPGCDGVDAWAASPTTGAAAWAPVRLVKGSSLQNMFLLNDCYRYSSSNGDYDGDDDDDDDGDDDDDDGDDDDDDDDGDDDDDDDDDGGGDDADDGDDDDDDDDDENNPTILMIKHNHAQISQLEFETPILGRGRQWDDYYVHLFNRHEGSDDDNQTWPDMAASPISPPTWPWERHVMDYAMIRSKPCEWWCFFWKPLWNHETLLFFADWLDLVESMSIVFD